VVSDDQHILITSANLTEPAFDRNYELGLLVHDEALARAAASQFQTLVDLDLLTPLPSA
jgi:phosphatidylserine/phosphatidylglycerophosphate/cardiolipin synthase-like enzyme